MTIVVYIRMSHNPDVTLLPLQPNDLHVTLSTSEAISKVKTKGFHEIREKGGRWMRPKQREWSKSEMNMERGVRLGGDKPRSELNVEPFSLT